MTPYDYLDPKRFPLTTRAGLDIEKQMMTDAFNHDSLRQMAEEQGRPMNAGQAALWAELKEKMAAQKELRAALKATATGDGAA